MASDHSEKVSFSALAWAKKADGKKCGLFWAGGDGRAFQIRGWWKTTVSSWLKKAGSQGAGIAGEGKIG